MQTPTPISIDHAKLLDALLPVTLAAARIQMSYFRGKTAVSSKPDASPVTAADQESETLIVTALNALAPGIPVVAEEAAAAGHVPDIGKSAGQEFFLIDPLDGTREFIADRPEFTINIALVRDGTPRFGIVYAPALGILYASLGDASAIEASVQPTATRTRFANLTARPIRTRAAPAGGLIAVASRSHGNVATDAFLGQYRIAQRIAAGSSLKFCVLAKGEADIYPRLGRTCEWDTAAGHAVLVAAGGIVTTLDGQPLTYGRSAPRFLNPDFVAWGQHVLPVQY